MSYTCPRCGVYTTSLKTNLKRHLNRKRPCVKKSENDPKTAPNNSHIAPNNSHIALNNSHIEPNNSHIEPNNSRQTICQYCHKVFSRKSSLKRHILHSCKFKDKRDVREENRRLRQLLNMSAHSTLYDATKIIDSIPGDSTIPTCKYCHKIFSRRDNLTRHETLNCEVKKEILEENRNLAKMVREDGKSPQHISNISNNISNISNNNSHNTTNTTNINVTLNAYGNENIGHLIPVVYKLIKYHAESAVTDLICERYFDPDHPENKTVMLKPKEKWPGRKYNGEKWEVDDKNPVIIDVLKQSFTLLDKMFAVVKHTMHPFCDWTEIRKKWGRKEEPSTETKEITEKILMNQSLSGSGYRKKENGNM